MQTGLLHRLGRLSNSFYMVVVLIQLLLVALSILFTRQSIDLLERSELDKAHGIAEYVSNQVQQTTTRALIGISGVVNNPAITRAFQERDRNKLREVSTAYWESIKPLGFAQFQFHIPTEHNTEVLSFLRMHEPERFNDSLTAIRPTVVKATLTHSLVSGMEQGRYGYSFRAVAPVDVDGTFVGTVELGFEFGDAFLKLLNANYPGQWGVYNLQRGVKNLDDRIVINALGDRKEEYFKNTPPADEVLSVVRKGDYYRETDASSRTTAIYIPVRNFQGDVALVVKYVYPSPYYALFSSIVQSSALICGLGLVLSSLIVYVLYRMITVPIGQLVGETKLIKNFQLSDEVHISSSLAEVRELIDAMKAMKTGLQSFRKYVPAQVVRQLIETRQEARISGQRKDITVFFSDIEGFTNISESLTPNELASQLSEYLDALTEIILRHQGTVDKYIGDAIMAFWGAPIDMEDHATKACLAALECEKKVRELAIKWQNEGKKPFHTRIGVNSGEIVVGNIGSEQRFNYTVIGDDVNLANRLEDLNKQYRTKIIISQNTVDLLPNDFAMRMLDYVVVKGKSEPIAIYELVAEKGDISSLDLEFLKQFNRAVEAFTQREWDDAIRRFRKLLEKRPDDVATGIYIQRCENFKQNPPPEAWRGEFIVGK